MSNNDVSFWDHLEVLRWSIIRCGIIVVSISIVAFCFKEVIFDNVILAPCRANFYSYHFIQQLSAVLPFLHDSTNITSLCIVNIDLASQLFVHMRISFAIGLLVGLPYLVCEIWHFVVPALYHNERKVIGGAIWWFVALFFLGVVIAYYIIFPATITFLGNYQVSSTVTNTISLSSYISTFLGLIFTFGIIFELPIVAYFFAKIGVLNSKILRRYRKVAFVLITILSAIITPSTDAFTMFLVALPLWFLYEFSRIIVKRVAY